jgi:FkbM family methyltransferase
MMTPHFLLCATLVAGVHFLCAHAASVHTNHRHHNAPRAETSTPWWQQHFDASLQQGPLHFEVLPYNLSTDDATSTLQALCLSRTQSTNPTNVIVDVGLPTEASVFSRHGYRTFGFEASSSTAKYLQKMFGDDNNTVIVHAAVSNRTGMADFYLAHDSSSLSKSAVGAGVELDKWKSTAMATESVPVVALDNHVKRCDAMKLDAQGNEPEILMGAESILTGSADGLPVIYYEYCTYLRDVTELHTGLHLLRGLGYVCYSVEDFGQAGRLGRADVSVRIRVDLDLQYCGNVVCTRAKWPTHQQQQPVPHKCNIF